jgi:hypothetical protein
MRRLFLLLTSLATLSLPAWSGLPAMPRPPAAAPAASDAKVEVDNPWVHVVRLKQPPHDQMPLADHPDTVIAYLTDARQRFTDPTGKTRELDHKAGDVAYFDAARIGEENIGDALEGIFIELKPSAPKSADPPITLDPVKLDPEHHPVVLENNRVRVLRTILEPHLKSPLHQHPHYVVVYLTELHTTMTMADGKIVDNPRSSGEVAWRDALSHVTENIGARRAVEIQVEIK